jgi:anti-anti-sigma factor
MADLEVRCGPDGSVCVSGELDMVSAHRLAPEALELDGTGDLVLDVSRLSFIDSTGIRAILNLAARTAPRPVVLRHPRPNVEHVLNIVRIDTLGIRVETCAGQDRRARS